MEYKTSLTTKDKVLLSLKRSNGYVSGEDISTRLALSRAAVNACVKSLRAEGYDIASSTKKGYCLLHSPDLLTAGEIAFYLQDHARMNLVCCMNETDSTNAVLLSPQCEALTTGGVAVADKQTAGRGRMGRSFYSPAGKSVYLSYLIRPLLNTSAAPVQTGLLYSPAAWTALTSCVAVVLADVIEQTSGLRPQIKWVNDLYLGDKKVTGILTQMDIEPESAHVRSIVIGAGINVNGKNEDFPQELQGIAGTVESACGHSIPRARLAALLIEALDCLVSDWPHGKTAYLERYRKDCFILGKQIMVISKEASSRTATALDITEDFALLVRYEDGTKEALNGGEISIRF